VNGADASCKLHGARIGGPYGDRAPAPPPLTQVGDALLTAVRVLGPLLLGLALLAIRDRVKR
jgi:hypothetical protein